MSPAQPISEPTSSQHLQETTPARQQARQQTEPETQLSALLHSAASHPLDGIGWIRVTGEDRVRWLNGMVTNSIQSLAPGQGCYNFLLNAQGRIQGDATIFLFDECILIETAQPGRIASLLDHFIIMDDVELTVLPNLHPELQSAAPSNATRTGLLLAGPEAPAVLQRLQLPTPPELSLSTALWQGLSLDVFRAHSPLIPRFELWSGAETIAGLSSALAASDVPQVSHNAVEYLRLLEGTPLYGTDIRNSETARDLPQETNQTRALHFNKGCYLGQEIVERIRSRGNVHRTFTAFRLQGELPPPGTALESDGKPVGELTSVASIPLEGSADPLQLALGYSRREALDRPAPLVYPGGTAHPIATPYQLPETPRPFSTSKSHVRP